jgi:hypothetical protein
MSGVYVCFYPSTEASAQTEPLLPSDSGSGLIRLSVGSDHVQGGHHGVGSQLEH